MRQVNTVDEAIKFFNSWYLKHERENDIAVAIAHGRTLAAEVVLSRERELQINADKFCAGGCRINPPPDRFCRHVLARREIERRLGGA